MTSVGLFVHGGCNGERTGGAPSPRLDQGLGWSLLHLDVGRLRADVIKIEVPGTGDDTRGWGPPYIGDQSAYFLQVNRNKRSMTLNLKDERARDVFMSLAKGADAVVENFTPGVVNRLGIDYEAVRQVNPRIVYCSISGFGQTGPYRERSAYDQVMQGMGGIMSLTGEPGSAPMKMGIALTDIGAGMLAAFAVMSAIFRRHTSQEGQYIDISMMDLQVAWLTYQAGVYFATGSPPAKTGAAHPTLVPYQAFKCSDDKYVNVAVGSERLWQRFCLGMGLAELAEDPDYVDNSHRVVNRQKLVSLLQKHFDVQPVVYWVERLLEAGVPCGAINDIADVLSDEQVMARDMLLQIPHPTLGTLQQTGIPVKFSETPGAIKQHPPLLGEHTQQILLELGYSESQVADLEQAGAI